mgnify:CR=1 FL=1
MSHRHVQVRAQHSKKKCTSERPKYTSERPSGGSGADGWQTSQQSINQFKKKEINPILDKILPIFTMMLKTRVR